MKILFIYPNAEGYGRIPLGMSIIMTILMEDGHKIELFDTTFILRNEHTDNITREKAKLVLPTDISHLYQVHSLEEVNEMLRAKINGFSPDLIAVGIVEDNYRLADHLLSVAKSVDKNIPVIVGGSTPTVAPEVVIENPHIDYLIQGEGEEVMREFCALFEQKKNVNILRNLWYKQDGELISNPLRHFVDMDTLPVQNLDLWDKRHFVKPYDGRLYQAGFFEMSRGCLNKCTYCINGSCQRLLSAAGRYHREKSITKAINEIKTLKDKFNFEMIFFCDDDFLLMGEKRMTEFAVAWKEKINLPYWINTTVQTINRNNLIKLKETGCCGIGIGIESGSEWLRRHILGRKGNNEQIEKTFRLIHEFNIRTTANNMIGFPGEYESDIFETIKLARRIKPKSCDLCFVAPYFGTAIHSVSQKLGYIQTQDRRGFKGMAEDITVRRGPVINMPQISRRRLMEIFFQFMDYAEGRLPIPERFAASASGCSASVLSRGNIAREVKEVLSSLF